MRPARTVLDSALRSLARRVTEEGQPPLSLDLLAAARAAGAEPPAAPSALALKLIVQAGRESDAAEWLRGSAGTVHSAGRGVLVADVPPHALGRMDRCPGVLAAEAPRELRLCLEEARGPFTGLDEASARHALTGRGVVVGIVDSGVDWRHPDFRGAQGETRLALFGHARRAPGAATSLFDEYSRADLDAALGGAGGVPDGDPHGHGTHCASIAAGNGNASGGRFRGAAPGAELVAVRSEPLLDTHIIWGLRRVFAAAGERSAVASLSLGGHLGAHDGTTALENVIARESGPGRIVVVAAGNEGQDGIHFRGELRPGEDLLIPVRTVDARAQLVDVWVPRGDEVEVWIETPDGARHDADGSTRKTVFGEFEADWSENPINRDQNLTLFIAQAALHHTWHVGLRARTVVHGEVHAWAQSAQGAGQVFAALGDDRYSIGMPATEERCIAVGSCVSRASFDTQGGTVTTQGLTVGQLSPFSSRGPGRYGALKPNVAAPGQYVTAALAAGSKFAGDPRYVPRHHPVPGYITIQGTSMATPFVAGVVALLLEREPRLTPEDVQQRLRVTARRDTSTGRVWGDGFGFGRLDVEALLDYQP